MKNNFQHNTKNFDHILKRLHHEIGLLKEWFSKDFPESRLEVIVDANNILMTMTITVKALMGKEMAGNRGHFQNKIVLKEEEVFNLDFMNQFLDAFGWAYRKEISRAINAHYNQEKEREEAGVDISHRKLT